LSYHLSHTSSPFCFRLFFKIGSHSLFRVVLDCHPLTFVTLFHNWADRFISPCLAHFVEMGGGSHFLHGLTLNWIPPVPFWVAEIIKAWATLSKLVFSALEFELRSSHLLYTCSYSLSHSTSSWSVLKGLGLARWLYHFSYLGDDRVTRDQLWNKADRLWPLLPRQVQLLWY
jgi:hypothetical protein